MIARLRAPLARPPRPPLERLIARHGAWPVIAALIGALLHRPRRPAQLALDHLPPHLRRDLGLPPAQPSPRYWDIGR